MAISSSSRTPAPTPRRTRAISTASRCPRSSRSEGSAASQDFWASTGFRHLERRSGELAVTDRWLVHLLGRDELRPPSEAGPRERALHAAFASAPRAVVSPESVAAVEDPDARENWSEFLRFRDRLLRSETLEETYRELFRRPAVDIAPPFVDLLAQAIVRGLLDGSDDAWMCRAGELFFRPQRVSAEGGQVLAADAATLEAFAQTGGFGGVGRLLREQGNLPAVKMDILNAENAPLYFLRDELFGFALDLTPGREGVRALARVMSLWIGHLAGVRVTIEPVKAIEDARWRWHVGLDVDASAILDRLYRGETLPREDPERLIALFRLEFADAGDVIDAVAGRPVYLGVACRADRTMKLKPQNVLVNLPLRGSE